VSALLLGEMAITIVVALPVGMLLGWGLVELVAGMMHSDQFQFPVVIRARTYAWAAVCVVAAGVASALVVRRRVDRLDLVAALTTRECFAAEEPPHALCSDSDPGRGGPAGMGLHAETRRGRGGQGEPGPVRADDRRGRQDPPARALHDLRAARRAAVAHHAARGRRGQRGRGAGHDGARLR